MTASSHEAANLDCVRARVHGTSATREVGDRRDLARTRAIPEKTPVAPASRADILRKKISDAASLHVVEPIRTERSGWFTNEHITTFGGVCGQITPEAGSVDHWYQWLGASFAGLFRAAVIGGCWLGISAVATRLRAGVALAIVVLASLVGLLIHLSA